MMSDHRRGPYRYETDGETYGGFWNTPSVVPQHGYEQNYPQNQHQYYPAASSTSHHDTEHYHHSAIPLSPPSSRPVSVSPDENSLAGSSGGGSGGHLMPLYSTGRPSFHSTPLSYTTEIKPDPDREDQRHFFQQHHHISPDKVKILH